MINTHLSVLVRHVLQMLLSSATSVFGRSFRAMYVRGGELDVDASECWEPRALAVVFVTTMLGLFVRNRGTKMKIAFGFIGRLVVAFAYIRATR